MPVCIRQIHYFILMLFLVACGDYSSIRMMYGLRIDQLSTAPSNRKTVNLTGECTSGVEVRIESKVIDGFQSFICPVSEKFSEEVNVKEGTIDGAYRFDVKEYDNEGKFVTSDQTSVLLDYTPPEIVIVSPEEESKIAPIFNLVFTCSEKNTLLNISNQHIVDGGSIDYKCLEKDKKQKVKIQLENVLGGSLQSFILKSEDVAGNRGRTLVAKYKIQADLFSPMSIVLHDPVKSPSNDRTPEFSVSFANYVIGGSPQTLFLYKDQSCSQLSGSIVVGSNPQLITSDALLTDSSYNFYAQVDNGNQQSSCVGPAQYTLDTVRPTVVLSSNIANGSTTNQNPISVSVVFSEPIIGFELSDISVVNGTPSGLAGSGTNFSFNIAPMTSGPLSVSLLENVAEDGAGNLNIGSNTLNWNYDATGPLVTLSSPLINGSRTNQKSIPVTARFSEVITGFTQGDLSISNGTISGFSGSGSVYTFNFIPTSNGPSSVMIQAGVAMDSGGNPNTVSNILQWIFDEIRPTVSLSSGVSTGMTNTGMIPVVATFSEIVTGFMGNEITAINGTISGFSGSGLTYKFNVLPRVNGLVRVNLGAGIAQDLAGNNNLASNSLSWNYDGDGPSVVLSSSVANGSIVGSSPILVSAVFSENVTGLTAADFVSTNATISGLSGSGRNYSFRVTPVTGLVSVKLGAGAGIDESGNPSSESNTLSWTYDGTAPTVVLSSSIPTGVTSQSPIPVTAVFSENVSGLLISDFMTSNATISGLTGSGMTYQFNLTPMSDGAISVILPANRAEDGAGNGNSASNRLSWNYDGSGPSVVLSSNIFNGTSTRTSSIQVTAVFSEPVTGLTSADFSVINGTVSGFTGSGMTYMINFLPINNGNSSIRLLQGAAIDGGGNPSSASNVLAWNYDNIRPSVTLASSVLNGSIVDGSLIGVTATFSEPVLGFTVSDITSVNSSISNFSGSGTTYSFSIRPASDGVFDVIVMSGVAADEAGNTNLQSNRLYWTHDGVGPSVVLSSSLATGTTTSAGTVVVTATFSESVTGFIQSDISASNGTISNFSGSGEIYRFNLNPANQGSFSVIVNAGVAVDLAGNRNQVSNSLNWIFDDIGPRVTLSSSAPPTNSLDPIVVRVNFSEAVMASSFNLTDILIGGPTGASTRNLIDNGSFWSFEVKPNRSGKIDVMIPAGRVLDSANNSNVFSNQLSWNWSLQPNGNCSLAQSLPHQFYDESGNGLGTIGNPYLIYSADQFYDFARDPRSWDKNFKQCSDIDFSTWYNIGAGKHYFTIGSSVGGINPLNSQKSFRGTYNGNSMNLSNWVYDTSGSDYRSGNQISNDGASTIIRNNDHAVGIFSVIGSGAKVYGLQINSSRIRISIQSSDLDGRSLYTGLVAGHVENAEVYGISVNGLTMDFSKPGSLQAEYVGGLFGSVITSTIGLTTPRPVSINNLEMNLNSVSSAGGISGRFYGVTAVNLKVTNSSINSACRRVGGISGILSGNTAKTRVQYSEVDGFNLSSSISYGGCENLGGFSGVAGNSDLFNNQVTDLYLNYSGSGANNIGGFLGWSHVRNIVKENFVDGRIVVGGVNAVGGFFGFAGTQDNSAPSNFENCYSDVDLNVHAVKAGGFGSMFAENGEIKNSYSSGSVTNTNSNATDGSSSFIGTIATGDDSVDSLRIDDVFSSGELVSSSSNTNGQVYGDIDTQGLGSVNLQDLAYLQGISCSNNCNGRGTSVSMGNIENPNLIPGHTWSSSVWSFQPGQLPRLRNTGNQ